MNCDSFVYVQISYKLASPVNQKYMIQKVNDLCKKNASKKIDAKYKNFEWMIIPKHDKTKSVGYKLFLKIKPHAVISQIIIHYKILEAQCIKVNKCPEVYAKYKYKEALQHR